MRISFCGATEEVTGSNFLVEVNSAGKTVKFVVDCGLFQGPRETEIKNWNKLPYNPQEIDFAIATHSHIDHIGRFPLLCKQDFHGKIYSTKPTAGFAQIFLEDTCKLMKNTADDLGQEPLFEQSDVLSAVNLFEPHDYYEVFQPAEGIEIKFYDAGHILGSAIIEIEAEGKTIIFSGDLGNPPVPVLRDTDFIEKADFVVMESTYGDRIHEPSDQRKIRLAQIIEDVVKQNGVLLMPSFALERTQEILYELNSLFESKKIPQIPVFIDSPLAIKATEIYKKFPEDFDTEAESQIKSGDDLFNFPGLKFTPDANESRQLDQDASSKIIIAGSGMSNGGRIVFHERRFLPVSSTVLLIIGYQVTGTMGRMLKDGTHSVRIKGEQVPVAARVEIIDAYSAHADQPKLKYWLSKIQGVKKCFIVHGEDKSKRVLSSMIKDEQGVETVIPKEGEEVEI
ncbi:MAG: MBL fold metallo-hydrolase [Candidatus Berkelbacteria bacterium]|nr:MBL fold metallo-hydrolase [Candidatus Berkelbacteria bacterium]